VGAGVFAFCARRTRPRHGRRSNFFDQIEFDETKETPDVEIVYTGDRASRTTASALFAVTEHFDAAKHFGG
jgi:hypothetical protein